MIQNQLLFFNISGGEIVIIILAVLLVFGPKKVPELARNIGKAVNQLRNATEDIKKEIMEEANNIEKKPEKDIPKENELK